MELKQAEELAQQWVHWLKNRCERIEIAGSIRRRKLDVHDIEIVAVPHIDTANDLFGNPAPPWDYLEQAIMSHEHAGDFKLLKNGPRFKQLALPEGINIDVFIVREPAQWGVIYLIRTGPAEFSRWMVTPRMLGGALPSGYAVSEGRIISTARTSCTAEIACEEEADFFTFCGLDWIEPSKREPRWNYRR